MLLTSEFVYMPSWFEQWNGTDRLMLLWIEDTQNWIFYTLTTIRGENSYWNQMTLCHNATCPQIVVSHRILFTSRAATKRSQTTIVIFCLDTGTLDFSAKTKMLTPREKGYFTIRKGYLYQILIINRVTYNIREAKSIVLREVFEW